MNGDALMDGWMMHGYMDGLLDGRMDGCTDGGREGGMNGCKTDRPTGRTNECPHARGKNQRMNETACP